MRTVKLTIMAFAALGVSLPLWAGPADTPNIDQRQINQQNRIDQGVQSGSLTPKEAARLERGQARIQDMENRAKADGVVTPRERQRIRHAQDVQNRQIAQKKHNRRHR